MSNLSNSKDVILNISLVNVKVTHAICLKKILYVLKYQK